MHERRGFALLAGLAVVFGTVAGGLMPGQQPEDGHAPSAHPGYERVSVRWESIGLSNDSRTIWASASYPPSGFCVKRPDGMDVEVEGDVAYVTFWMRGPDLPLANGTACSDECFPVSQTLALDAPLTPAVTSFRFAPDAEVGCAARGLPARTPVTRRSSSTVAAASEPSPASEAVAKCGDDPVTDLSHEPKYDTSLGLHRWTVDGCPVRLDVIMTRNESSCPPENILIGIPLGTPTGSTNARQYEGPGAVAAMPDDATNTGYIRGEESLWLVPGDYTAIYLRGPSGATKWPAYDPPYACA